MQSSITLHNIEGDAVRCKLLPPGNLRDEVPTSERDWVSYSSTCSKPAYCSKSLKRLFAYVRNVLILELREQLTHRDSSF